MLSVAALYALVTAVFFGSCPFFLLLQLLLFLSGPVMSWTKTSVQASQGKSFQG